MKIDLDEVLKDVWGKPIMEAPTEEGKEKRALTLGMLCANAFLTPTKGDAEVTSVDEKLKAYHYARKFADGGVAELTVDEVAEVRRRVAKVYYAMLAGPALELLQPRETPAAKTPARARG